MSGVRFPDEPPAKNPHIPHNQAVYEDFYFAFFRSPALEFYAILRCFTIKCIPKCIPRFIRKIGLKSGLAGCKYNLVYRLCIPNNDFAPIFADFSPIVALF